MNKQFSETMAMFMVGDGLLAVLYPRRHVRLWRVGPSFLQNWIQTFVRHPLATRLLGGAEAVLGIWLAHKQYGSDR